MATMKKALFPLLFFFSLAAAWYYWQQRPVPPLTARLLPFDAEAIERISIALVPTPAFELHYSGAEWIAEQASRSLVVRTPKPVQLLDRLLGLESEGLAKVPLGEEQMVAQLQLQGTRINQELTFYEIADSSGQKTFLQLNNLPDRYYLPNFSVAELPLRFEDYEDFRLLDLSRWMSLDSLVWLQDSSRQSLLLVPQQTAQLDSLHQAWYQLRGQAFATEFDEVGEQDRYFGTYRLFSAGDSLDLLLYRDTNWPDTLVVSSSQFPKNFFWLSKRWF